MRKTSLSLSDVETLRLISVNGTPPIGDRTAVVRLLQRKLLTWVWGRFELTPRGERFLEILASLTPDVLITHPQSGVAPWLTAPVFANASSF